MAMHRSERLTAWILSDRARALFGYFAIYLHATRDEADPRSGLTATRLKDLAVQIRLCSAGRAAAMLGLMRTAGYIARAPGDVDRRVRRLVPTERLHVMMRMRLGWQFEALSPLLPEAARALPQLDNLQFGYALVRALGDYFMAGFRLLDYAPELGLFAERDSGMIFLYSLLLAGTPGAAFPPEQPVPLVLSDTSRKLGVSRTHALRLIRDAEAAGLLTRTGARGEAVWLSPGVAEGAMNLFAVMFLYLASGARAALAEFEVRGA